MKSKQIEAIFVQFHSSEYGWYAFKNGTDHEDSCMRILNHFEGDWDKETHTLLLDWIRVHEKVIVPTGKCRARDLSREWHETFVCICDLLVLETSLSKAMERMRSARESRRLRALHSEALHTNRKTWINECETLARHEAYMATLYGRVQERLFHQRQHLEDLVHSFTPATLRKAVFIDAAIEQSI